MRLTVANVLEAAGQLREAAELVFMLRRKLRNVHQLLLSDPELAGASLNLMEQYPEVSRISQLTNQLAERLLLRDAPRMEPHDQTPPPAGPPAP